jgi:hypothetical protein
LHAGRAQQGLVVGDEHAAGGDGMRCDQHVEVTQGRASTLEVGAQRAISCSGSPVPGHHVDQLQKFMHRNFQRCRLGKLGQAGEQFALGDGRHRQLSRRVRAQPSLQR